MCLTDIYGHIRTKKLTVRQKDGGSNTLFRYVLLKLMRLSDLSDNSVAAKERLRTKKLMGMHCKVLSAVWTFIFFSLEKSL